MYWENLLLYIRLKLLRTMPTDYQNPISIIISVVLIVLYRTLNLTDFGGGPNGPKIKNVLWAGQGRAEKRNYRPGRAEKFSHFTTSTNTLYTCLYTCTVYSYLCAVSFVGMYDMSTYRCTLWIRAYEYMYYTCEYWKYHSPVAIL